MKNIKLSYKDITSIDEIPLIEKEYYSKMKYWEINSIIYFAEKLSKVLIPTLNKEETYFLASSPYGHVETAANQLNSVLYKLLKNKGYNVTKFKITRHWGFNIDNYATMSEDERKKVMSERKLTIPKDIDFTNKNIIVLDDIKITWKHQIKIEDELNKIDYKNLTFLYIYFNNNGALPWNNEALLNESYTKEDINMIIPFFQHEKYRVNSRTLKLLLNNEKVHLTKKLLQSIPEKKLKKLYLLSKWADKYFLSDNYKINYLLLERYMSTNDLLTNKIVKYNAVIDNEWNCLVNWNIVNKLLDKYSRFKFWDINEIKFFSKELAKELIYQIEHDSYTKLFFKSIAEDEVLYLICPWIRNVASSSNMLMKYFAMYVNPYLSKNKFPTFIVKSLTRIKSGSANYAELTEQQRLTSKTTSERTIVPTDEFVSKKAHVFFIDDVEVTGATYQRIKKICLDANVLSFTSLFVFKIVNQEGDTEWQLEHYINTYTITWKIDDSELIKIINDTEFSPVQRLLRLVLSSRDKIELLEFYTNKITNKESLCKIYYFAMSNDYLWIKNKEYREGLLLLEKYLENHELLI